MIHAAAHSAGDPLGAQQLAEQRKALHLVAILP
jgi:hypothetical protein